LGNGLEALDAALECLLPPAELLDASLMGLCVAAEIAQDGAARLKVYVNGEVGDVRERYRRFADCLTAFNRHTALRQLGDVTKAIGGRMVPAFIAVDLSPTGIGRLKLYFRPTDGTPALQALAAKAVGCANAAAVLDALHRTFLIGQAYPVKAVDVSVEFPEDDGEPGFKVDLRMIDLLSSDAEADFRIRQLVEFLGARDGGTTASCVMSSLDCFRRIEWRRFFSLASPLGGMNTRSMSISTPVPKIQWLVSWCEDH
jgi:hypothetical protein